MHDGTIFGRRKKSLLHTEAFLGLLNLRKKKPFILALEEIGEGSLKFMLFWPTV